MVKEKKIRFAFGIGIEKPLFLFVLLFRIDKYSMNRRKNYAYETRTPFQNDITNEQRFVCLVWKCYEGQ